MRLAKAAEIVENGIDETLSHYAMPLPADGPAGRVPELVGFTIATALSR